MGSNFPNLHCAAIRFMQCPRVSRRSDTPTRLEARATSTAIASPNLIVVICIEHSGLGSGMQFECTHTQKVRVVGGNRDLITPGYAPAGAMITR